MAKIPDAQSFGVRPTPAPAGLPTVPNVDATLPARAIQQGFSAMTGAAVQVAQAQERIKSRTDTVERARSYTGYNGDANKKFSEMELEGDFSTAETSGEFNKFLTEKMQEYVSNHDGSNDSKAMMTARLESMRSGFVDRGATAGLKASQAVVTNMLDEKLNSVSNYVYENPAAIDEAIVMWDEAVEDASGSLRPEIEMAAYSMGRQRFAVQIANAHLDVGAWRETVKVLRDSPELFESMGPEVQRDIQRRIAGFRRAELEAETAGLRARAYMEAVLGRPPTPAEVARKEGFAASPGEKTPQQELAELEDAVGPLTREQKLRHFELQTPGAKSPEGKYAEDRANFIKQYGAGSIQVQAMDEAEAARGKPALSDVKGMRTEFTNLSGDFIKIRQAYAKILTTLETGAGDIALIFSYMKMIDPPSTVREGEFATAAQTAGVPQRIVIAYNKAVDGQILSEPQREAFREQAELLMKSELKPHLEREKQYQALAERNGMNPLDVTIDYVGDIRPGGGLPDHVLGEEAPTDPNAVQYDLGGNPIVSGP